MPRKTYSVYNHRNINRYSNIDDPGDQIQYLNQVDKRNTNKVYQNSTPVTVGDKLSLIESTYNDFGIDFSGLMESWIVGGASPEEIKNQIRKDLNYDPSIAEVEYLISKNFEKQAGVRGRLPFKKAYANYMSKVGHNKYRTAACLWQVKAYHDGDGQERMFLVRIDQDGDSK